MIISKKAAVRSPWFVGWIVLLVTVIAMNVYMIMLAVEGNPGLVADDYYERGQLYDKKQNERMKSHPGWKVKFIPMNKIRLNEPTKIVFELLAKNNLGVSADQVTLYIYRPSDKQKDFVTNMVSEDGLRYFSEVNFSLKGIWDLVVEIKKDKEIRNFGQRITVYE